VALVLVVISDLHLRDDSRLTVSPEATRGFLEQNLIPQVRSANVRELTVVFLGDIFDINRSPYWVDGRSTQSDGYSYTPWSHWRDTLGEIARGKKVKATGGEDARFQRDELEHHTVRVLDEIAAANADNISLWQEFKSGSPSLWGSGADAPSVNFRLIPGNHDRLVQYTEGTRDAMARAFSLDHDPEHPFPWVESHPEYSVLAFHGHQLSSDNFGGKGAPQDPVSSPWYDFPSLGDVVTVTFGSRLLQRIRSDTGLGPDDPVIRSLEEIDLVRPQMAGIRWLKEWGLGRDAKTERAVTKAALSVLDEFLRDDFVRWWGLLSPVQSLFLKLGIGRPSDLDGAWKLFARRAGSSRTLEERNRGLMEQLTGGRFGAWLRREHSEARYIVSGHTHRPTLIPLAGRAGGDPADERVYFNTGTWLDVVESGRFGGFARRDQITHVTFYAPGEDVKAGGARRSHWEYWRGSLREGPA
jgi:UDP-2,3-diacylglucosamine pyrophosphatase LpxH